MAAPTLVLAACAALGPPAAAAAVRRRAGAVELLSLSPKFDRLFPDGVVGEVALAEGRNAAEPLRWLEGPTWLEEPGGAAGDGEDVRATVLVSDVIGNRIWRWREPAFTPRARTTGGEANIFLEPSGRAQSGGTRLKEPGSNGLLWSAAHRLLFLCDHGNRRIAVARPPPASAGGFSGEWVGPTTLVSRAVVDGKARRLNSPNDLAFAPDGSLWFTDPSYGLSSCDDAGECVKGDVSPLREIAFHGVYRVTAAALEAADRAGRAEVEAELMLSSMSKPNGIAFHAKGATTVLYVSNTGSDPHIARWEFPLDGKPQPEQGLRFADAGSPKSPSGASAADVDKGGYVNAEAATTIRQRYAAEGASEVAAIWDAAGSGGTDGLAIDGSGRVWAVCPGGVCVFSPSAELLGTVVVNAKVGNVVLGGDGWLYIAASSEMLRVQTTVRPWVP